MRDRRKDEEYYKTYLDYQYSRIEKKSAKLAESEGEKKQRILLSLTGYETDLLKAEFSYGASKEDLRSLIIHSINIVYENVNITFDDLLTFLSLIIMLEVGDETKKIVNSNENTIQHDRLLRYLATYIETGKGEWNNSIPLREEYGLLNRVFSVGDKVSSLTLYLEKWYKNHSEYAWYNSHLRNTDTYCGYWSFEAGAIAKILKVDGEKLSNSEYFPVL